VVAETDPRRFGVGQGETAAGEARRWPWALADVTSAVVGAALRGTPRRRRRNALSMDDENRRTCARQEVHTTD